MVRYQIFRIRENFKISSSYILIKLSTFMTCGTMFGSTYS